MTGRKKRCLLGCSCLLLAAIATLAVLEWQRRRHVAAAGTTTLDDSGQTITADDLEEHYHHADAFAQLCAEVKERSDAQQRRFEQLQHIRKTRQTRYDAKGETVAVSEAVYQVQFRNGKEQKQLTERRQLLGTPSRFDPEKLKLAEMDTTLPLPFSASSPDGLYRYRLEGVEELQGRRLLRIHFEPSKSVARTFKGSVWVDPQTRETVRLHGSLARERLGVDHLEIMLEYGPSENDCYQLRRVVMDVAGGFALVSLHYRIESELSAYRRQEPKEPRTQ